MGGWLAKILKFCYIGSAWRLEVVLVVVDDKETRRDFTRHGDAPGHGISHVLPTGFKLSRLQGAVHLLSFQPLSSESLTAPSFIRQSVKHAEVKFYTYNGEPPFSIRC